MSATITDYFNKASNMNGSYPPVAEVTSARAVGGSVLTCDDLSGWATATPVHFSTFTLASDGTVDTSTQTDWKGIVVGNTITEMTRLAGAADSGNASGDKVELNPTIGWLDDLITGILVSHKQNGGLKDSVVTEDTIATGAVTSSKVAAGAISSYDKISDGVIQARNIVDGTITADKVDLTSFQWHLVDRIRVENVTSAKVTLDQSNPFGLKVIASVEPRGGNGWCDVRAYDSNSTILQNTRSFIELDGSTIKSNQNITGGPCAVAPMTQYYSSQIEATSVRPSSGGWRSWNFHASNGLSTFVGGSRQNSNTGIASIGIVTQYSSNIYLEVWVRQTS